MANDNNNGQYRFLLDAKNGRQFALFYDADGKPQRPLHVFAEKEADAKVAPGEVFFAIDDEPQWNEAHDVLTTHVYRFEARRDDPTRFDLKREKAEYALQLTANPDGSVDVNYALTESSAQDLRRKYQEKNLGFDGFPTSFKNSIDADDSGLRPTARGFSIDPQTLRALSFPPHHKKKAIIARMALEKAPKPQQQKATPQFNRKAPNSRDFKVSEQTIEGIIKQFCKDLTERAKQGRLDPVVGRDAEIHDSITVMSRRKQASLCFTGEAGVGKSAMFSGVAQYIAADKDVPDGLKNARVLELDINAMVAGTKYRGQFEERLKPLIDGLMEREGYLNGRKIILAIDEIHDQLKAGGAEGTGGAGQIMKPFLTAPGISVMGTTTAEEYRQHIEKDSAMASRFEQKVLSQPDADATKVILKRLWPLLKDHHGLDVDLSEKDFDYVVTMTNRYAPNEAQPRKGEKVLDMAGASAQVRGSKSIDRSDIIAAVAQMSKLSVDFLSQNDGDRFLKMEEELPRQVLGQPCVADVVNSLIGARSGLNDPNQPWAAFVFQGPTGTGKTELCKAMARYLFGDDKALIKLDMGEYAEKHTISRLIGAPPGYVGFDTAEPALTEKIRQKPYSILLLDEIEKAHPDVFNVLLPILNDGKMTDNHGKTVLFNNVIVVMTTNLGAREAMTVLNGGGGFDFGKKTDPAEVQEALARKYEQARGAFFKPEIVNRIEELGGFKTFIPLVPEVVTKLVDREIDNVNKRASDKSGADVQGLTVEIAPEVKAQLAEQGYKPDMGARPLRKVVREKVANPLGKWIMAHRAEIVDFIARNGGEAKLFLSTLGGVPQLLRKDESVLVAAANDDKPASAKPPKKDKSFGF
jgi:ATP-dependent Clp protease ATP-binding subunit ClpC